ncbi:MAG: hypothetical protein U0168_18930 [Nannocystaceae bacterium]
MVRRLHLLATLGLGVGCPYDPEMNDPTAITGLDDSSGTAGTSAGTDTEPTTDAPTSSPSSTVNPDSGTDAGAVCGDGNVGGNEVCDDGTNDGSYGGCMPDCSALAEHCGDAAINGPEVCDDGTNDGGYDGCESDCSALGPHCGDGTVNGSEDCDNGEDNQNGSGCNLDCVTSGSLLATYDYGPGSFCDGVFLTPISFRDNGNVLVGATGYCNDDSVALVELDSNAALVQSFDTLLLPTTPVREATLRGDDWLLSASGCNYIISPDGDLTAICEDGRLSGYYGIAAAADDGTYATLDYEALSLFPATSPTPGDAPTWTATPPDNASFDFAYYSLERGINDSVVTSGTRRTIADNTYTAHVARFTEAGNLAGTYTYPGIEAFYDIAASPVDGTIVATDSYPNYRVIRLDMAFDVAWVNTPGSDSEIALAIDSTGSVVMAFHDSATQESVLRKMTPDGTLALWSVSAQGDLGYVKRLGIDAQDAIWVAAVPYLGDGNHLTVAKFAP